MPQEAPPTESQQAPSPQQHVTVEGGDQRAALRFREMANLALAGKFRCMKCQKIAPQSEGFIVSMLSATLMAMCPSCLTAPIVIVRDGDSIRIQEMGAVAPQPRQVLLPSELPRTPSVAPNAPLVQPLALDKILRGG